LCPGPGGPGGRCPRLDRISGSSHQVEEVIRPVCCANCKNFRQPGRFGSIWRRAERNAGDKWLPVIFLRLLALPRSTASVSQILRFASKHRDPGHGARGRLWLRGWMRPGPRRHCSFPGANEPDQKSSCRRFLSAVAQAGVFCKLCRMRWRRKNCIIRPTPPAARIAA